MMLIDDVGIFANGFLLLYDLFGWQFLFFFFKRI